MHKFLYLCLVGTVLAGSVSSEAWAINLFDWKSGFGQKAGVKLNNGKLSVSGKDSLTGSKTSGSLSLSGDAKGSVKTPVAKVSGKTSTKSTSSSKKSGSKSSGSGGTSSNGSTTTTSGEYTITKTKDGMYSIEKTPGTSGSGSSGSGVSGSAGGASSSSVGSSTGGVSSSSSIKPAGGQTLSSDLVSRMESGGYKATKLSDGTYKVVQTDDMGNVIQTQNMSLDQMQNQFGSAGSNPLTTAYTDAQVAKFTGGDLTAGELSKLGNSSKVTTADGSVFVKSSDGAGWIKQSGPTSSSEYLISTDGVGVQETNMGGYSEKFLGDGTTLTERPDGYFNGSDGKMYKVDGETAYEVTPAISTDGVDVQETNMGGYSEKFLGDGTTLTERPDGYFDGSDGKVYKVDGEKAYEVKNATPSAKEQAVMANEADAEAEVEAAAAGAVTGIDKAIVFNVAEYVLQILQAYEEMYQDDATKEITVQIEKYRESQGDPDDGSGSDSSLGATTISSAANAMATLLKNNPLNTAYLDESNCVAYGDDDTTSYKECMQGQRKLFANTAALSAQMISEGSNAISAAFQARVNGFIGATNGLGSGSLGAMSVINDAERYPYFEMVRGSALSAVQLGVKEAGTLFELDILEKEAGNAN